MSKSSMANVILGDLYFRHHIARFHDLTELDSDEKIFTAVAKRNHELNQLRTEVARLQDQLNGVSP